MALVKEDGSIVTGANAYVDVAFFESYFEERGGTVATALVASNEDLVIGGILYATRWIDNNHRFRGTLIDFGQPLNWPRSGAIDDEGRSAGQLPGVSTINENVVPNEVQEACAEVAFDHAQNAPINETVSMGDGLKKLQVGPISLEFRDFAVGEKVRDLVDAILSRWTLYSGSGGARKLARH